MYTINFEKKVIDLLFIIFTLKEKKINEEPLPKLKLRKRSWRFVQKV